MEKQVMVRSVATHQASLRTAWAALWLALVARLRRVSLASALIASAMVMAAPAAHAADGCKVLLCLAGNWSAIGECVPPVREVLRDLARGRPFPTCAMAGAGNSASLSWASEATCPPMYSNYNADSGRWESCTYAGSFNVRVEDADWSTVFWSWGGDTSTWYTPKAKSKLGSFIDPKYDADQAAWEAAHPPPPPCTGDC